MMAAGGSFGAMVAGTNQLCSQPAQQHPPGKRARSSSRWDATPTGQLLVWHTRAMMQPVAIMAWPGEGAGSWRLRRVGRGERGGRLARSGTEHACGWWPDHPKAARG